MDIALIFAASENNVIGRNGTLPWHLPADQNHFKQLTTGNTVIMGRRTYESIGHPLPYRENIIVTRSLNMETEGCLTVSSLQAALEVASNKLVFIIGGAQLFSEAEALADRVYLTRVHAYVQGDISFSVDAAAWEEKERSTFPIDNKHSYSYSFITLIRKSNGKRQPTDYSDT
jgi:dihydrofolate reductase